MRHGFKLGLHPLRRYEAPSSPDKEWWQQKRIISTRGDNPFVFELDHECGATWQHDPSILEQSHMIQEGLALR